MDAADHAQEREAAFLEDRLRAQEMAAGLGLPGRGECVDCAEVIPAGRRRALPSAVRCVGCQDWHERVAKIPA